MFHSDKNIIDVIQIFTTFIGLQRNNIRISTEVIPLRSFLNALHQRSHQVLLHQAVLGLSERTLLSSSSDLRIVMTLCG